MFEGSEVLRLLGKRTVNSPSQRLARSGDRVEVRRRRVSVRFLTSRQPGPQCPGSTLASVGTGKADGERTDLRRKREEEDNEGKLRLKIVIPTLEVQRSSTSISASGPRSLLNKPLL